MIYCLQNIQCNKCHYPNCSRPSTKIVAQTILIQLKPSQRWLLSFSSSVPNIHSVQIQIINFQLTITYHGSGLDANSVQIHIARRFLHTVMLHVSGVEARLPNPDDECIAPGMLIPGNVNIPPPGEPGSILVL